MHFFRTGVLLCICLGLTVAAWAKSEEKMQREMTAAILSLVGQAADNFPGFEPGQEAYKDADKTVSLTKPSPALHANLYFLTVVPASQRHFLGAQYQGADAVRRLIAAVRAVPEAGGAAWTIDGGPGEAGAKWVTDIRRDGYPYGSLNVNPADNTAILSIGVFATPMTDPAEITRQVDEVISQAEKNFNGTPRAARETENGTEISPALMHSDTARLHVSPQYYSTYEAKWYDASPGSKIIRDTLYAHLDELVASGRARKQKDETDSDGRTLEVWIDHISVQVSSNHLYNHPGVQLEVGRIGEKPGGHQYGLAHDGRPSSTTPEVYHPYAGSTSSAPASHEHMCVRCDGRGKIDTSDAYGHYVHVTCPICGGSGRVN